MSLQKLITNYAEYNVWANQLLVNWLSQKTDEQLHQEIPSSFSSILKTLNHIWAIEEYWYAIITGNTDTVNRYGIDELKKDEIFEGLMHRSTTLANAVKAFTNIELEEIVKVVSPWFEVNQPRYEYIQHLNNHSTYHRGQITTIARNLGITDAPMTDYNAFNIMKEQKAQ